MTETVFIPDDIATQLGELTETQQGVIERLLQTVGDDHTRELLVEAAQLLATTPAGPNIPTGVRGMLMRLLETALPPEQRIYVLKLKSPPHALSPDLQSRWHALSKRLKETRWQPKKLIRTLIATVGIETVEAAAAAAEQIESEGGMLLADGSRRRTLGGVFFYLMRQQLTPEQQQLVFSTKAKPPGSSGGDQTPTAPAAPAEPALPDRPVFVWAERKGLYQELAAGGEGRSVKITLMGRPGKVIEKQDVVITSITVDKKHSLPKGVPAPLPTTYSVYVGRKQWAKVSEAIQNPEDSLIIEGVACYDPDMEGIMVSASNITTKLLQQAKKQPAVAEG